MQHAFVVVRQNHGIEIGQQAAVLFVDLVQAARVGPVLEVEPYQLLLPRQDAQFQNGGHIGAAHQVAANAFLSHQFIQRVGGFVVAYHGKQRGVPAQCGDIARHVRRSARAVVDAVDFGNRHGGFGGNARHVAKPVAVEHDIAHHQDFALGKAGKIGFIHNAGLRGVRIWRMKPP